MSARLKALERLLRALLPSDYKTFLASHRARDEAGLYISSNPENWGVRSLFELGDGPKDDQLDRVYQLVGDVLPPQSLPIAEDWSGNLYLLMHAGSLSGHVVWWNHEREENDFTVQDVASSFTEFLGLFARDES
jgi:hypothetical protein